MIVDDRKQAQIRLLLVEDDPDDAHLVKTSLARRAEPIHFEHVAQGLAAKALLEARRDQKALLPEMMIVDINMPLMNGLELLDWIRSQPDFDKIVVVIFTTSTEAHVLADARRRGANGALSKEWHDGDQHALGQMFVDYWFHGGVVMA